MKWNNRYILSLGLILIVTTGCSKDIRFASLAKDGTFSNMPIEQVEIPPIDGEETTPPDDQTDNEPSNPSEPTDPTDPNVPPYGDDYEEPEFVTDTFEQSTGSSRKLDLLIVLDNSDSMFMDYTYRDMRSKMNGILSSLDGADYQIAFTSTDVDPNHSGKAGFSGAIGQIIKPSTANKEAIWQTAVSGQDTLDCRLRMGPNCGSNEEQPLKAAMMAVEQRYSTNAGFIRDDADLAVLVISDEEENTPEGVHTVTPSEALQSLRSQLGSQKNIRFYGAIIQPGDLACYNTQRRQEIFGSGAAYSYAVASMASMTGGRTVSFCDASYTASGLSDIATSAGTSPSTQTVFTLSADPIEGTVFASLNPISNIPYTVVGRTVTFETAPSPGTQISITFEKQ